MTTNAITAALELAPPVQGDDKAQSGRKVDPCAWHCMKCRQDVRLSHPDFNTCPNCREVGYLTGREPKQPQAQSAGHVNDINIADMPETIENKENDSVSDKWSMDIEHENRWCYGIDHAMQARERQTIIDRLTLLCERQAERRAVSPKQPASAGTPVDVEGLKRAAMADMFLRTAAAQNPNDFTLGASAMFDYLAANGRLK